MTSDRLTAAGVMTSSVITVTPETPIKEVAERLLQHHISGVPVVDEGGRVVGIVTEADLLLGKEAAAGGRFESLVAPRRERRDWAKARAEHAAEAMSSPVITTHPDASLAAVARLMRKHSVKRVPVVDGAGHLVGIVSRHDILSALARPDGEIRAQIVERVLPHWLGVDPALVHVSVDEGIVSLSGELERRSDADVLAHLVHGVDGVVAVRSEVTYRWDDTRAKPPREHQPD